MNALRTRTQAIFSVHQHAWRFSKTVSARQYSSNPVPENTPHTPDTYQKDEEANPPASSKTHVVGGDHGEGPRTQRPFESPSGSYTNVDSSKPYESPAKTRDEDQSKLGYGGSDSRGGGAKDVHGSGSPHDSEGKSGRR